MDGSAPEFVPLQGGGVPLPGSSRGRGGGGRGGGRARAARWWASITEDDVISLEPIAQLKYEPINVKADDKVDCWFDPKMLANYLVSTKSFVHPLNRRDLSREECQALELHLERVGLERVFVCDVYDHRDDPEDPSGRITDLQRQAEEIMQALYHRPARRDGGSQRGERGAAGRSGRGGDMRGFGSPLGDGGGGGGGGGGRVGGNQGHDHQGYPGLMMIDDDEQGDFLIGEDSHPANRPGAGYPQLSSASNQRSSPSPSRESFPSLGGQGYRPAAPIFEPKPITRHQPPPRPPQPQVADDGGVGLSGDSERDAALASAFGVSGPAVQSVAFADAEPLYTPDAIKFARKHMEWLQQVERAMCGFCKSNVKHHPLPPMSRQKRKVVHEMAEKFGFETESYDREPNRYTQLSKPATSHGKVPNVLLSAAASDPDAIQKSIDTLKQRNGLVLHGVAKGVRLESVLSDFAGTYTLAWVSDDSAILAFHTSAALKKAAEWLGGGRRGQNGDLMFRVEVPRVQPVVAQRPAQPPGGADDGLGVKEWAMAQLARLGAGQVSWDLVECILGIEGEEGLLLAGDLMPMMSRESITKFVDELRTRKAKEDSTRSDAAACAQEGGVAKREAAADAQADASPSGAARVPESAALLSSEEAGAEVVRQEMLQQVDTPPSSSPIGALGGPADNCVDATVVLESDAAAREGVPSAAQEALGCSVQNVSDEGARDVGRDAAGASCEGGAASAAAAHPAATTGDVGSGSEVGAAQSTGDTKESEGGAGGEQQCSEEDLLAFLLGNGPSREARTAPAPCADKETEGILPDAAALSYDPLNGAKGTETRESEHADSSGVQFQPSAFALAAVERQRLRQEALRLKDEERKRQAKAKREAEALRKKGFSANHGGFQALMGSDEEGSGSEDASDSEESQRSDGE